MCAMLGRLLGLTLHPALSTTQFGMLNNSTTTAKAFTVEALFALKAMSKATI